MQNNEKDLEDNTLIECEEKEAPMEVLLYSLDAGGLIFNV